MAMIALTFSSPTWSLLCILQNLLIIAHFLPSNAAAASDHSSPSPSSSPRSLCNPREDSLFLADSTNRQAFFQCRSFVELPSIGFWERHFCPNDMHFAYGTQQCTANSLPPEVVREANELFRIAILNGSCANGERCIGGTVCDRTQHRCLCPYGTVAVLESLYCEKISRQHPEQQQQQWRGHQQQQQLVHPPYGVFHVAQPHNQMNVVGGGTPFAALFATVAPGSSCAQGELCGGGSVCLPSHGICVCPQGMENYAGRCVDKSIIPNGAKFERNSGQMVKEFLGSRGGFIKASLGERCNDYFGEFCADQSAFCKEGRCRCVVPMVELNGRCQKLPRQETGPGEPCNGGQECVRGTVCHQKMGVCVCSEGNELNNGLCIEREGEVKLGEAEITTTTTTEATGAAPVMVSISSAEVTTSVSLKASRKSGESTVGKKCSLNADCLSGAYCNGNSRPPTCQCISTHVNVNDRCEKVIYPGQRGCETDLQCSAGYAGTRCIGRQCVCPPGSTAIDRTCIPDNQANTDAKNCSAQPEHSQWKPKPSSSTRQRQKSSTGRKVSVPGALCGPLDNCTGGSFCVEGFCLCPAGTRPSPTSGNCETFAQQRKTSVPTATTERKLRRGDTELSTAPAPISSNNQISTKSSETVPATEPSILSSPLTDGPLDHNRNNSEKMRMLTSFTTDGKELEILSKTLFRNGTDLSALGDVRATYGTNPSVGVKAYNFGDEVKDSTTSETRGRLINLKSVRRTLSSLERAYARPSESCSGAEICTGGSICDRNNKVCECPAVKPILRNHICIRSDEPPMINAKEVKPGDFCNSETKCMGNSVCAEGSCRCQRGFRLKDVHCMGGQDSDSSGVLPPVQLSPEKELQQQSNDSPHPVSSTPQRLRSRAKPRISGPPLRRTTSSPVLSSAPAGTKGVCPPGNSPLTDQSTGLLRQCNGMRPNCPPKSYCFVTGVASEVYNCCKSY